MKRCSWWDGYHLVTLHQGIVDKLYNEEKEKNERTNGDVQDPKQLFFIRFLESFEKLGSERCIIHTGRGKPNYIKGKLPYRSLSDLDYAIKEPKVTLINYFNSASYEY